jgi:thymidylate kinase
MTETDPGSVPAALARLDEAGVAHCVWKGSDHLRESFAGDRDLDLLVDPAASLGVTAAFEAAGLRRAPTEDPRVADWFGLAPDTGALVQIQVYAQVLIDDGAVARWAPPWAEAILRDRRREAGVWVVDPAMELVLLLAQAAARNGPVSRHVIRSRPDPRTLGSRLDRLAALAGMERAAAIAAEWLGPEVAAEVSAAASTSFDPDRLRTLLPKVGEAMAPLRLRHAAGRIPPTAAAVGRKVLRRVAARTTAQVRRRGRRSPSGGLIVAVVGADGSGKSTVAGDLAAEYQSKLDTLPLYFGSGAGAALPLFRVVKAARRIGPSTTGGTGTGSSPRLPQAVWGVALAWEKRRKLGLARRARASGAVVVCDRYPQLEVPGIHDGPRLAAWDDAAGWRGRLATWERRAYAGAADLGPDLVVRLDVSAAEAMRRRPEHDPADLRRRVEVVRALQFEGAGHVEDVVADQRYEEVLRDVRTAVFRQV